MTPTAGDLDALRVLIECMEQTSPLTQIEIEVLHKKQGVIIRQMLETGETWNQASSGPSFLSLDEQSFRSHLGRIDNNLGQHVAVVSQSFARYLGIGTVPAPYYPWRIAVILRRARTIEVEKRFLAAWCRHFPEGNGRRYAQLTDRLRRLECAPI
jgi:hypothetical protein